jgi:ribosomal protein S18 acetylase RimI-like enzyme
MSKIRTSEIHERNIGGAKLIVEVSFPIPCHTSLYTTLLRQDLSFRRLAFFNDIQVGMIGAVAIDDDTATSSISGALPISDVAITTTATSEKVLTKLYILTLAVLAAYRNCGVGTTLVKEVIDAATLHPYIDEIFLHVWILNADAIRFYERLGFKKTENVKNYYRRIESPDAVVMRLQLPKKLQLSDPKVGENGSTQS